MDILSLPVFSVLILIAAISLYFIFSSANSNLPPGPYNFPIIGSLHRLGTLPHISVHNLSKKYGAVMYLKLGNVPAVFISTEQAAKEIFNLHGLAFASRAPLISGKYFGNDYSGFGFGDYTPEVKRYRKLINTHLLSAARLKAYDGIRREEQRRLAQSIRDECGRPVHLRQKFHDMNMNVISYMLFGHHFQGIQCDSSVKIVDDGFVQAVVEALRLAGVFNFSDYIPGIRWLDIQGLEEKYKKIMATVNTHLFAILRKRRENPPVFTEENPMAFIDVLISMDSTPEEVSDMTKISLLYEMLLGAVDTSALTLEWAMAELLRHPEELFKARREVDDVVGSKQRLVDVSDVEKLPYVEAIAKETLRLRSVIPLALPKIVKGGPIKVCGYTIPDATTIYINSYSIGIDESFWKRPLEFQPQRFMDESVDVFGQSFNLLPFGTGRRVCPGSKHGFNAVQIGIATLVQGFDWKVDGDLNMQQTFGLVFNLSWRSPHQGWNLTYTRVRSLREI